MNEQLQKAVIDVIGRYLDIQVAASPQTGVDKFTMRLRRSDPSKAYKQVDFAISGIEQARMSTEQLMEERLRSNFETLVVALMEDTNTVYQLQMSWLQRLYFLFTGKLLTNSHGKNH